MYVPSNDSFQSLCSFHDTFKVIRVLIVKVDSGSLNCIYAYITLYFLSSSRHRSKNFMDIRRHKFFADLVVTSNGIIYMSR